MFFMAERKYFTFRQQLTFNENAEQAAVLPEPVVHSGNRAAELYAPVFQFYAADAASGHNERYSR